MKLTSAHAWALAAILVVGGCGRDEDGGGRVVNPPATPSTQMTGVFVSSAVSGLLDLTIDAAPLAPALPAVALASATRASGMSRATVNALGVMSPDGGGVVNLTGAYDTATDSLHLSGQGYELAGLYLPNGAPPRLEGRFTGPSGSGSFLALAGGRSSVRVFCATYEDADATLWGTLNLAVSGTSLAGLEVEDGDTEVVTLAGSVSGSGVTPTLEFLGATFQGEGTWNLSSGHVEGTWSGYVQSGEWKTGVWSGDPCLPGTTGSQ